MQRFCALERRFRHTVVSFFDFVPFKRLFPFIAAHFALFASFSVGVAAFGLVNADDYLSVDPRRERVIAVAFC